MGPEVIKVTLSRQTNEDLEEFIWKQFVAAIRKGDTLCLDCDKTKPNWTEFALDGTFSPEQFFDRAFMNTQENYMRYVREEENHGIGGINPGFGYIRSNSF